MNKGIPTGDILNFIGYSRINKLFFKVEKHLDSFTRFVTTNVFTNEKISIELRDDIIDNMQKDNRLEEILKEKYLHEISKTLEVVFLEDK